MRHLFKTESAMVKAESTVHLTAVAVFAVAGLVLMCVGGIGDISPARTGLLLLVAATLMVPSWRHNRRIDAFSEVYQAGFDAGRHKGYLEGRKVGAPRLLSMLPTEPREAAARALHEKARIREVAGDDQDAEG